MKEKKLKQLQFASVKAAVTDFNGEREREKIIGRHATDVCR